MGILELLNTRHQAELKELNYHISKQLENDNSLMSKVVSTHLRTKGKQLRPLLVLVCAKMFAPLTQKAYAAAAAVELLHNASLIHDDVVDNSPTRRGNPTINAVWDNHIAVLVGDFFTSSAMKEALSTGDIRIVDSLCSLGRTLSLGEIDQIHNAREHHLSEDNYYKVIDYKTASLFVSSAEMGCLASGVDDHRKDALSKYALLFGRCFQIRDDIFDYYSSELVGKPTGNDLREGKISLPLLYALRKSDAPNHAEILAMVEQDGLSDQQIEIIQDFARKNGGIDYSFAVMEDLRTKAMQELDKLPDCTEVRELRELFDFVITRKY